MLFFGQSISSRFCYISLYPCNHLCYSETVEYQQWRGEVFQNMSVFAGSNPIPVIDLFAGPGGLGEGFSASVSPDGKPNFRLVLSIEKDFYAHSTLELRAFYRQFERGAAPEEYYAYLKGKISRGSLFQSYPEQARTASQLAWHAELGDEHFPPEVIDSRIQEALNDSDTWVLIGGPPCQAYSTIGRSRMRRRNHEASENDKRHLLYKQYLRILAVHSPPVFIMENVRGILSSRINGQNIFERILDDLQEPESAAIERMPQLRRRDQPVRYRVFSLTQRPDVQRHGRDQNHFVIEAERHGVPQNRHRVIVLGIREDLTVIPRLLRELETKPSLWDVLSDLPELRSCLSREKDSGESWVSAIQSILKCSWLNHKCFDESLRRRMAEVAQKLDATLSTGGQFLAGTGKPKYRPDWFCDERMQGVCNHSSRYHMRDDLHRYLFATCFVEMNGRSPLLKDFPEEILPQHKNVGIAIESRTRHFSDRFRVQMQGVPSTTITSHMTKDGHYFIHPDPLQCRSLTVREAARLQSFSDDHCFEGEEPEKERPREGPWKEETGPEKS